MWLVIYTLISNILVTWPRAGRQSIAVSMYVYLYVCMSVCLSMCCHVSKTTCPNVTKFSVHFTCICGCGDSDTDDSAIGYVLNSLWMTSCYHVMEPWARIKKTMLRFVQFARWLKACLLWSVCRQDYSIICIYDVHQRSGPWTRNSHLYFFGGDLEPDREFLSSVFSYLGFNCIMLWSLYSLRFCAP